MDTLHKLAGVQETSDRAPPSQPIPQPPPIPQDDVDKQTDTPHLSHRASRASLPMNRQPSHKSFRSSRNHSRDNLALSDQPPLPTSSHYHEQPGDVSARPSVETAGTESEDFAWGPGHPCFPHPNPHCLPESEEYKTTRVIRVRRDWLASGDLYPQYANLYPEILDPLVSDTDFRFLITNLNGRLKDAFNPFGTRAWVDSILGVVTGFLWDDLGMTGVKKGVKSMEAFIEKWNKDREQEGKEVRLVQLRRTGFMALDFIVPDPGIDMAPEQDHLEGGIGPAE